MNGEHLEFVRRAVEDGMFVRVSITSWKPARYITIKDVSSIPEINSNDAVNYKRTFKLPQLNKSKRLASACGLAVKNLAYWTKYGYFVPGPNIKRFKAEMNEFRTNLAAACEEVLGQYEDILKMVKKQAADIARCTWNLKYGYEGEPHQRFVESFVDDYLKTFCSPDEISVRFRFRIDPCHPIVRVDSPYARFYDCEDQNTAVYENVYEKILNRRRALVKMMIDMDTDAREARSKSSAALSAVYRRTVVRLQRYMWSIFYADLDQELLDLIDELRSILIVADEERTFEVVCAAMKRIRDHVVGHPFFRTGMEVVDG